MNLHLKGTHPLYYSLHRNFESELTLQGSKLQLSNKTIWLDEVTKWASDGNIATRQHTCSL